MKNVMISYSVKPEMVDENAMLVKGVMDELNEKRIPGLNYAAYKVGENEFIHMVRYEDDEANEKLLALPSFIKFRTGHAERALTKPVTTPIAAIGSYCAL